MMADIFSAEKRSWIMSQIRGKDTSPEIEVRSIVHRLGFRFRLHQRNLPGNPDIVLPSHKKIIFVHGCFWHGHSCSRGARSPKSNREYWAKKIGGNLIRDKRNLLALRTIGWDVLVVWECELRDRDSLLANIQFFFQQDT